MTPAEIDKLFHSLADATRRDIVVRAATGDLSVSALARSYPMSVTAVQKHVAVLESAGLVTKNRSGREQIVTTDQSGFAAAREVLAQLEALWRGRLGRFGVVLGETTKGSGS